MKQKFSPSSITTPLLIEAGDVTIDAYGTYDAESGALESVTINKRELPISLIDLALGIICPNDIGQWSDDLDGDTLNVLLNEAEDDATAEHGGNSGE